MPSHPISNFIFFKKTPLIKAVRNNERQPFLSPPLPHHVVHPLADCYLLLLWDSSPQKPRLTLALVLACWIQVSGFLF